MDWDDLRTVTCLVETGTLAGAAERLGITYTTVSRRITRAEGRLGVMLFERLADGYAPTEAALTLAEAGAAMAAHHHAALRRIAGQDPRLSGAFTLTAPQLLIAHVLGPVLDAFTARYPEIDLTLRATNDILDLTRREADLAIRISRTPGDSLTGLRLTEQQTASFASRDWAARHAEAPGGPIDWILFAGQEDLPKHIRETYPQARIRARVDDMVAMVGAAEAGLGVIRAPLFLGRSSALVQVPLLPPQPYADIWIVGHPDLWRAAKARAFRELLVPYLRAERSRFVSAD